MTVVSTINSAWLSHPLLILILLLAIIRNTYKCLFKSNHVNPRQLRAKRASCLLTCQLRSQLFPRLYGVHTIWTNSHAPLLTHSIASHIFMAYVAPTPWCKQAQNTIYKYSTNNRLLMHMWFVPSTSWMSIRKSSHLSIHHISFTWCSSSLKLKALMSYNGFSYLTSPPC